MKSLLVAIACLAAVHVSTAEPSLSTQDVTHIGRICRQFFGAPAKDIDRLLRQLRPYVKDQRSYTPWVCSGQHCRGAVALRGDTQLVYGFSSIPDPSVRDPMDIAPDAVRKGNNRINAIGLLRHGTVLFAIPATAAPFLIETSSNQAIKRIATR